MPVLRQRLRDVLLAALVAAASVHAGQFSLHGRASGWLGVSRDSSCRVMAGTRYLPEVRLFVPIGDEFTLDAEASVNGLVSANVFPFDPPVLEARIKPYRGFVRLSCPRFEARAGLQKISFGSAMLLRPLMWFDRVDPRDPLALTDGVYGLLGRYYFQNNTNVWAWGLLGNASPRGWDVYGSQRWSPESGVRLQVPVSRGEVAATYHHRRAEVPLGGQYPAVFAVAEDRFAFDGKWDVGVGVYFEAMAGKTGAAKPVYPWQRAATVGLDYTIGLGNGLGVAAEHMLVGVAGGLFDRGTDVQLSAVMFSLPLGLVDNLRAILYHDWEHGNTYSYFGWQRTFDKWLFSLGAFWNPVSPVPVTGPPVAGVGGKGLRLDVVYNH